MSFDPFHEQQPPRDPAPRPPLENAASNNPDAGGVPMQPTSNPRERIVMPAVLLIITGVLNLLYAGYFVVDSVIVFSQTPEQLKESAKIQRETMIKFFLDRYSRCLRHWLVARHCFHRHCGD